MEQNELDVLGRRGMLPRGLVPVQISTDPFGIAIFSIGFPLYMQFGNSGITLSS